MSFVDRLGLRTSSAEQLQIPSVRIRILLLENGKHPAGQPDSIIHQLDVQILRSQANNEGIGQLRPADGQRSSHKTPLPSCLALWVVTPCIIRGPQRQKRARTGRHRYHNEGIPAEDRIRPANPIHGSVSRELCTRNSDQRQSNRIPVSLTETKDRLGRSQLWCLVPRTKT